MHVLHATFGSRRRSSRCILSDRSVATSALRLSGLDHRNITITIVRLQHLAHHNSSALPYWWSVGLICSGTQLPRAKDGREVPSPANTQPAPLPGTKYGRLSHHPKVCNLYMSDIPTAATMSDIDVRMHPSMRGLLFEDDGEPFTESWKGTIIKHPS